MLFSFLWDTLLVFGKQLILYVDFLYSSLEFVDYYIICCFDYNYFHLNLS